MLVPEERRGWASGTVQAGTSTGMLLGAACGGLLVTSFGAASAFLINALSFVVSALLVSSIRGRFRVDLEQHAEHRGALRGVRLLLRAKPLRISTYSIALVALGLGMANVAELPLFVSIGAGKIGFGVAVAAWAGGQITGGRLASKVVGPRRERLVLIASCALLSATIGLAGAIPLFAVVALLFVAAGIGNTLANVCLVLLVQRWAPPQVQSRALAAMEATLNTAVGISLLVGGLLLAPLGARGVYLLAGGLGAVATAMALRIPRDRAPIRAAPEAVDVDATRDARRQAPPSPRTMS